MEGIIKDLGNEVDARIYVFIHFFFLGQRAGTPQQLLLIIVGPVGQTIHTGNSAAYSYLNSVVGSLTSLLYNVHYVKCGEMGPYCPYLRRHKFYLQL